MIAGCKSGEEFVRVPSKGHSPRPTAVVRREQLSAEGSHTTHAQVQTSTEVALRASQNQKQGGMFGCSPLCCQVTCHIETDNDFGQSEIPASYSSELVIADFPAASPDSEESPYILLEDSDDELNVAHLGDEVTTVKKTVHSLWSFIIVLVLLIGTLAIALAYLAYDCLDPTEQQKVRVRVLLASIPIVALFFTWWHIWLAIQMMFRPIRFRGLWQHGRSGMGIGWQGIVPRKARKMAETTYSCGRAYLDGPRDWLSRVDASDLVAQSRPQLKQIISDALSRVGAAHFPQADSLLPKQVRQRVTDAATDKIQEGAPVLWKNMTELLCDEDIGVDNDGMIVKVFTENKVLLNSFFMSLGKREFRFIEHCGAAMGFVCGLVQLVAFNYLGPTGRAVFLPTTGFFLGIVSNWLAILVVFKPCFPIPIRLCGWHVCDIQGLFLKRQPDVAVLYSKLLCEHFLSFTKVINYLSTQPRLWPKLREEYAAFSTDVIRQTLGVSATWLAPRALGRDAYNNLQKDLKLALVEGLANARDIHKISGRYLAKATQIEKNNTQALKQMPPDEFENLLHPIFKEDEWILILLGGVLGAIVGIAQVCFLDI